MSPPEKSQPFQMALHEPSSRNHRFKPRCSVYFGSILITIIYKLCIYMEQVKLYLEMIQR